MGGIREIKYAGLTKMAMMIRSSSFESRLRLTIYDISMAYKLTTGYCKQSCNRTRYTVMLKAMKNYHITHFQDITKMRIATWNVTGCTMDLL